MRILVVSERLRAPADEGIKNYALQLVQALRQRHTVLAVTCWGAPAPAWEVKNLSANPLFLSWPLARRVGGFAPECVIYIPTAAATPFSFWRARMLKTYARGALVALVALQPRRYGRLARALLPRLRPDLVLVQGDATRAALEACACEVAWLPPAVDVTRFRPVSAAERTALRRRHQVDPEAHVVLHVGHLNRGRNVQALAQLVRPGTQVIVVGSTSTSQDASLVEELVRAGVRVLTHYVAEIAELYQLADCYVFPVRENTGAIDLPLSVLEAMACNLRAVTTRFGGLPTHFPAVPGLCYLDDLKALAETVEACRRTTAVNTRDSVLPYAWPAAAERLLERIAYASR